MKNLLSRISKKSVALLVAVALVLTSVATIVVASADSSERYTVTAKDPVVPMTAGYSVNLADFDIEGEDTASLTLDASVNSADIEIVDGVIKAYNRGVYKATAGNMTVYIVVKAPNETEYVLYENDYRTYEESEVSDWKTVFSQYNGTALGTLAAADNRVSSKGYTAEDVKDNPAVHAFATEEEKINRLNRNAMPVGFMPYDPNTLFWYDEAAFKTLEEEEIAAGGDGVISPTNYMYLRFQKDNASKKVLNPYGYVGYAVTILENDTVAAFQNYKVTASMRVRAGYYGGVGIAGRISDAADNFSLKNGSTVSTAVIAKGYWQSGVVTINNDKTSSMVTTEGKAQKATLSEKAANLYNIYYTNDTAQSMVNTLRVYEYDYNGDKLTISSPENPTTETDDATVTLASTENPGYIGFFTVLGWKDILNTDGNTYKNYYSSVPCVLDIKVTLNDSVDPSLLPTTKMDGVNAADKVFGTEDYTDNGNWYAHYSSGTVANALQYGYMLRDVSPTDATAKYTNCLDITKKIGDRLTKYVGRYLFRNGENHTGWVMGHDLGQAKLPGTVYHINDAAFYDTVNMEKINLESVESIGEGGLNSSGVREIAFGSNLVRLVKGSFGGCRSLVKVELGNRLTEIGNEVFKNCSLLPEITLPASVTTLGTNVFSGCTALSKVYVLNPELNITGLAIPKTATIYTKAGSTCATTAAAAGYTVVAIDAQVDKAVADYNKQASQFTSIKVPAKANIDLTKLTYKSNDGSALSGDIEGVIVEGSDNVTFSIENTDVVNGAFTIADGILTTGAEKATGLTFTAVYRGSRSSEKRTTVLNLEIVDEAETNLLDGQYEIIPETIPDFNIEPSATAENTYIINLTSDKTLIPNSIKVIDGDDAFPVFSLADTTGKAFEYLALREKATVTAEFTTENIEDDVFYLGSSIRSASEAKGAALKFMNRLPAIKYDGVNVTSDTITLDDGTTATVKAIGTLVIPSILLRDAELKIPANAEQTFNADTQEVVLGKLNGQSALNIKHKTVTAYSEDFSDVNAILGGLADLGLDEQQYKALHFSAVTYIQYTKADGTVGYSYGDVQEKSYAEIEAAMYPEYVKGTTELDAILEGGTENDFVNTSAVNSFSYSLNEDITFKLRIKGNYKINYVLMKDNPSENLYGNESVLEASNLSYLNATNRYNSNCVVASGQFDDRIFTITTQMKQPGTVRLMVEIIGKNGEVVETANLSALADYKNITAAYDESFYVDDATVKAMYDTLRNNVDTFVANTLAPAIAANSTQITDFITAQLTNPQIGAEYTLTHNDVDLMYLQTVYTGNKAVSFNYRIATNAIVGIKANDANHLFDISEGGTYDVASDATGLPTYNLRPSSGYIAIPKDVTTGATYGILGRYQGYGGYYWNPAYSSSSVIEVGTNGTGVINSYVKNGVVDETTKNTASSALGAKTPVNGGNNNFIFDSSKTEFEDPTQLFQYGMLIRNYTALKVVELLPFFDETKDVTMRGGSMGAWQSTSMAALYTKVNVLDIDKVWMCSIGVTEAGMLKSEFNPKASKASYYFTTINAAKQIGNREGFEATIEGYLGDYTSPPAGLAALYNVLVCKKSLTFNQYKNHSVQPPLGSGTKATATVSAAAQ